MQKKEEQNKFNFLIFLLHSLFGTGTLLVLLLMFALLVSSELIPANLVTSAAYFSVFLSSLVASVISAVKFGKKLAIALLQGLFYFLLIYLIGAVIFGRIFPDVVTPWVPASCFFGSLFGAVVYHCHEWSRGSVEVAFVQILPVG
mgnify:CR=1 FL=1